MILLFGITQTRYFNMSGNTCVSLCRLKKNITWSFSCSVSNSGSLFHFLTIFQQADRAEYIFLFSFHLRRVFILPGGWILLSRFYFCLIRGSKKQQLQFCFRGVLVRHHVESFLRGSSVMHQRGDDESIRLTWQTADPLLRLITADSTEKESSKSSGIGNKEDTQQGWKRKLASRRWWGTTVYFFTPDKVNKEKHWAPSMGSSVTQ